MSIEKSRKAVDEFLADSSPGVLAIKGAWGVGKTYFWSTMISEASAGGRLSFDRYAYVSLFGVSTLNELKFSIFENMVLKKVIGQPVTVENLKRNWKELGERIGRKALPVLRHLPWVNEGGAAIEVASFMSVRDTIICLDDFERKGEGLAAKDVMGLVSLLREQRNCKVVLIFNDANIDDDYPRFREKVVDYEIEYAPTADEAARLVFSGVSKSDKRLCELTAKLNIRNIRILGKVKRLVSLAEPLLEGYEEEILGQVMHTLTIAAYCYFSHEKGVPPFRYLKSMSASAYGFLKDEDNKPDEQKGWDELLSDYDFRHIDELDNVLFSAIESGYIDEPLFREYARKNNEQVKANKSANSFSSAWDLYRDSFENNEGELVAGLVDAVRANGRFISPVNLSETVQLFRDLGRDKEASEIIACYIDINRNNREYFDLESHPFSGDIKDKELIERFREVCNAAKTTKSLNEVLQGMIRKDGWGGADEDVLQATSEDQFYEFFKKQNTDDLSRYVRVCLRFGRFQNATDEYKEIAKKAENALIRIGKESKLNKIRVERFGVKVD